MDVESLGWKRERVETRLARIGDTLTAIYERARTDGVTTDAAAEQFARSRLART
ncbi:MAG: hypothetical protein WEB06_06020 [Actinomycetota bacterium]